MIVNNFSYKHSVKPVVRPISFRKPLEVDSVTFGGGFYCFMKTQSNIHCPYCDRIMFNSKEIDNFKKLMPTLKGNEAIKEIASKTRQLMPINAHKKVAKALINEIESNPERGMNEIIDSLRKKREPRLIRKQIRILNNVLNIANDLPKEFQKQISDVMPELNEKAIIRMKLKDKRAALSRKRLKRDIKGVFYDLKGAKSDVEPTLAKIETALDELPSSWSSPDVFIAKYGSRDTETFFEQLIYPLRSTADHIYTRESVGTPGEWDLLASCYECNSKRSNMPFEKWVGQNPKFYKAFSDYMNEFDRLLSAHPKYRKAKSSVIKIKKKTLETVLKALNGEPLN